MANTTSRRQNYTENDIAEMAARLRALPPKKKSTVGISDAIAYLKKDLRSALERGYTLEETVEILNQPEDRGLRVSTVRRYLATTKKGPSRTNLPASES